MESMPRIAVIVDQHDAVSSPAIRAVVLLRPVRSLRLLHSLLCLGARPDTDKPAFTLFDYVGALDYFGCCSAELGAQPLAQR